MTIPHTLELARLTSDEARRVVEDETTPVVLVPVAGTGPHGPHLPLGTDALIGADLCRRAAERLRKEGIAAFVAPALPYGAVHPDEAFAGTVSIPAQTLRTLVADVIRGLLRDGWRHVSVVNGQLDTTHAAALHAAVVEVNESGGGADDGPVPVSLPSILSRRWQDLLGPEGRDHAGRVETSLALAADGDQVRRPLLEGLAPRRPGDGETGRSLRERGYVGDPAAAGLSEGETHFAGLTRMVVTEVLEALGRDVPGDL